MGARPQVSLVMPVWRPRPDWLRAAVSSALEPSVDLELLLVDDGGDDGGDDDIAALLDGNDDARLRVIRIDHGGESAARNAGIGAATGRYIRFVDADDICAPGGTEALLSMADEATIVHAATMLCDEDMVPYSEIRSGLVGDVAAACLLAQFEVRHVSMLFPLDVVRAAGPWDHDIRVSGDWDFVQRCVELAPVRPTPAVATFYRRHNASMTRSAVSRERGRYGHQRLIEKYAERHPEDGELVRAAWIAHHTRWAQRALAETDVRSFVRETVPLTRLAPRAAGRLWAQAARGGARRSLSLARSRA